VRGRCRATNLCEYCRKLATVETVEMLTLDALEHAPEVWMVLTAREHLTRPDTYRHLERLRAAAKRRWPSIEWFVQVEFQRRGALHLNLLIKGVPAADAQALGEVLSGVWCARIDAEPVGQWVGAVQDGQGVVKYLSKMLAHGLKAEQAPPIGWRGHRTSQTRGYLVRPASVMRLEAREALAVKRELWKAIEAGLEGHDAELAAHEAREVARATSWVLVDLAAMKLRGEVNNHEQVSASTQRQEAQVPRVRRGLRAAVGAQVSVRPDRHVPAGRAGQAVLVQEAAAVGAPGGVTPSGPSRSIAADRVADALSPAKRGARRAAPAPTAGTEPPAHHRRAEPRF
jgi:hypothetical protein